METLSHKILLIDETGFLRVCSSILKKEGFSVETINFVEGDRPAELNLHDFALVILSYPYGKSICKEIRRFALPVIVLSDHISEEVICLLEEFKKSYCMIKPLDYPKFTSLVTRLMKGEYRPYAGYSVL